MIPKNVGFKYKHSTFTDNSLANMLSVPICILYIFICLSRRRKQGEKQDVANEEDLPCDI